MSSSTLVIEKKKANSWSRFHTKIRTHCLQKKCIQLIQKKCIQLTLL